MITTMEELHAENAHNAALANAVYAEVLHIAHGLHPDADVPDVQHAGRVWRSLRRAWHEAGEPGTFTAFVDAQLATVTREAA